MSLLSALVLYLLISAAATVLWALFFAQVKARQRDMLDDELRELVQSSRHEHAA